MAQQTIQTVNRPGVDLASVAVAAAGGGDTWLNTGGELVYLNNGSGAPITVTMPYASNVRFDGSTPTAKTFAVPAGHAALLGPFAPGFFNDPTSGLASLTYSGVTSLTICVFRPGTP